MASFRIMGLAAEQPTLLWTNPNPTSEFTAQTLNIDFSGYEYFSIRFVGNQSYYSEYETIFPVEIGKVCGIAGLYPNASLTVPYVRGFILQSINQISFDRALNNYNTCVVPIEIKGYKKFN